MQMIISTFVLVNEHHVHLDTSGLNMFNIKHCSSSRRAFSFYFLLLLFELFPPHLCQLSANDKRTLVSTCLDGNNHKLEPGQEDDLHHQCIPWKNNSCCTKNTTVKAHQGNMYGFNYNHCPGHKMSARCHEHFIQDLCFYECSPNIGPWIQAVNQKMRRERFFRVPLCATDCNKWFEDCKEDYTCTDNWARNFNWENGTNHCPPKSDCHTFREIFVNASNFCERIWDHSWQYTSDNEPCMRIWFNGSVSNPNEAVARWKIQQGNGSCAQSVTMNLLMLAIFPILTSHRY